MRAVEASPPSARSVIRHSESPLCTTTRRVPAAVPPLPPALPDDPEAELPLPDVLAPGEVAEPLGLGVGRGVGCAAAVFDGVGAGGVVAAAGFVAGTGRALDGAAA